MSRMLCGRAMVGHGTGRQDGHFLAFRQPHAVGKHDDAVLDLSPVTIPDLISKDAVSSYHQGSVRRNREHHPYENNPGRYASYS